MENTPIQFLDTEQENALYIKRDDLIPYSFGGNKARKACLFFEEIDMKLFLGLVVFIACISLVKLKMFAADSLTVGEDYLKSNMERSLYNRLGRNETELNEPARRIYDAMGILLKISFY